ncbi:MAG: MiaB/RimO family radical SAM methylthiotransferase [bacterium]
MRIAFKTFGCRLNQAETDRFIADSAAAGWQVVPFAAPADVVVIHGCAVTHTAELKCQQLARGIKRAALAAGAASPFVVLVGCVVEADAARQDVAGVDLLVARGDKERLVEIVCARLGEVAPDRSDPSDLSDRPDLPPPPRRKRAFLKVQDGCDFCCSYCIVPHTRGAPVSRPWPRVLDEARALAQAGFAELVVTGCNVACYRDGARGLADLLAAIAALDAVQRIRLSSVEPGTSEREIIDLMSACRKLCRYLHLPLQSGDAGTLRRMGRTYTPESFAAMAQYAAQRMPDLGLGTDIIAGFPGETDAAFERTRQFVAALPFSNLHIFPYSERPGTPAETFADRVPVSVRKARARELIRLGVEMRQAFARRFVGRTVDVLIEHISKDGRGCGWSSEYLGCRVAGVGRAQIGRIVPFTPAGVEPGGVLA